MKRPGIVSLIVLAAVLGNSCASPGAGGGAERAAAAAAAAAPLATGDVVVAVRRKTESQYRHSIASVFGEDIKVAARFEPETRLDGLLAIGAGQASVSPSGFQQYFAAAESIAGQVLDEKRRAGTVGCAPADAAAPDDACTASFVNRY